MTAKNALLRNWAGWKINFDGQKDSRYPNGDKPSGYLSTPRIAFIDVRDGPISGGLTGNGLPIRIYGYSFGRGDNVGTAAGARAFMRDPLGDNLWHEVGHYWYMTPSIVHQWLQLVELCIEPGALGGSMVAGRALDIKVTVNGVDSPVYEAAFTIQPGPFFYVDHDNGDDSTGTQDDPTKPFKHLQVYDTTIGNYTGLFATLPRTGGATVLVRGSTSDNLGWEGKYMRPRHHTGSLPDGTLGKGRLKFLNWPEQGSRSNWTFTGPDLDKGGITGVAQAQYGVTGMYLTISGYKGIGNPTGQNDASPMNAQSGARGWDIVGYDGTWPSATTGSGSHATAGGIAGQFEGGARILASHIHDVSGDPAFLENHGLYIGDAAGHCSKDLEVAYSVWRNCTGGSHIQCNNSNADTDFFERINIHHNWFENCAKYSINLSDSVLSLDAFNNIIVNPSLNAWRCGQGVANAAVNVIHNTVVQYESNNGTEGNGMFASVPLTSGTYNLKYNLLVRGANGGSQGVSFATFASGTTAVVLDGNQYFDVLGTLTTVPALDTTGHYGDPLFNDFEDQDFTLKVGSPCIAAVGGSEPIAVNDDFFGIARPVIDTSAPAANKNTIGACEGVAA